MIEDAVGVAGRARKGEKRAGQEGAKDWARCDPYPELIVSAFRRPRDARITILNALSH